MIGLILATKMEAGPLVAKLGAVEVAGEAMPTWRFAPAEGRPGGVIVVSGMGRNAAARGAEHLIDAGADVVINVGICGALREGSEPDCGLRPGAPGADCRRSPRGGFPRSGPSVQSRGREIPTRGERRKEEGGDSECGRVVLEGLVRISSCFDGDDVLAGKPAAGLPCGLSAWPELPTCRLASVSEPVFEDQRRGKLAEVADVVDMEGFAVARTCRRRGAALLMLKGVTDLANHSGKRDILRNIEEVSARLADVVAEGLARLGDARKSGVSAGKVMSFAKIEHSLFSLPLLLAGAKLGSEAKTGAAGAPIWGLAGWPGLGTLGLIALAGVGARTMGMAMNRIFDRKLDALNPRTAGRELPSGRMSLAGGLGVAAGGLGAYLLACWMLGPVCLALSAVPAVPLITYSLLKRFTNLCHFGIGLCLALAPLGAYVAASGAASMSQSVWLLGLFTFCWMSGFDIIYALQDMESDRQTGVRSLPVSLGAGRASAVAAGVHVVALASLVLLWRSTGGGWLSGAAGCVAVAAFVLGHLPSIPAGKRFFPISAIASVAGAGVPLIAGL
jgi:4-hydroxybenzoate polyprenyltransferase